MTEQPKKKVLTEQQKAENFAKEYQELCEKHGYTISVNPAYIKRDDGSWSTVLQTSVAKLPRKESDVTNN